MFNLAHSNIYQFIVILLNVQRETYLEIRIIHIINTINDIIEKAKEIGDQMQLPQSNTIT
jgi:hypothetical protein